MPRKPTFKRRMEEWIEDCEARMLSSATIETYGKTMRAVWRFAREHGWPAPERMTGHHVRDYYESLEDLSTNTQKLRMTVLTQFLKWCGNKDADRLRIRIQAERTRVNWLTEEQVGMAIHWAHYPALRAMLVLMSYTGMRAGEVVRLRVSDMREGSIAVRGKGRKARVLPVDKEFWSELTPYLVWRAGQGDHQRFLVHRGRDGLRPYTTRGLRSALMRYGRRLNLHMTPHTLRRSFGRHLYMRGCPLAQLRELMGHSTMEMTIQYLGIGEADIQQAIERFRPNYGKVYLSGPTQQTRMVN